MRHSKKQRAAFLRWQKRRIKKIMSEIANTSGEGLANSPASATDLNGGNLFWKTDTDNVLNDTECKSIESVFIKVEKNDTEDLEQVDTINSELGNSGLHTEHNTFQCSKESSLCEANFVAKVESISSGTSIVMKIKRETPSNAVFPNAKRERKNSTITENSEVSKDCPPLYVKIKTDLNEISKVETCVSDDSVFDKAESTDSSMLVKIETKDFDASILDRVGIKDSDPLSFDQVDTKVFEDSILSKAESKVPDGSTLNEIDSNSGLNKICEESVSNKIDTEVSDYSILKEIENKVSDDSILNEMETKVCDDSLLIKIEAKDSEDSILNEIETKVCGDSILNEVEIEASDDSNSNNVESEVGADSILKKVDAEICEIPILSKPETKVCNDPIWDKPDPTVCAKPILQTPETKPDSISHEVSTTVPNPPIAKQIETNQDSTSNKTETKASDSPTLDEVETEASDDLLEIKAETAVFDSSMCENEEATKDSENVNGEDNSTLDNLDSEDHLIFDNGEDEEMLDASQEHPDLEDVDSKDHLDSEYVDSKEQLDLENVDGKERADLENVDGREHLNLDEEVDSKELVLEEVKIKESSEPAIELAKEEIKVENTVVTDATDRKTYKKQTMQASTSGLNPLPEDESDENLSLDLHVSESEAEDACRTDDIPMEIEEEILNKFDGSTSPLENDLETDKYTENKTEHIKTNSAIIVVANKILENCDFNEELSDKSNESKEDNDESKEEDIDEGEYDSNGSKAPSNRSKEDDCEPTTTVDESRREETENEDLLLVLDEKTTYADETDYIDDAEDDTNDKTTDEPSQTTDNESSSAVDSTSGPNDTIKYTEEAEASTPEDSENAAEDSQRDSNNDEDEGNCQDDLPSDDFDAMEIEENEIQGTGEMIPSTASEKADEGKVGEAEEAKESEEVETQTIENALDENKENVTEGENITSVLKTLLTAGGKYAKGQKSPEGEKVTKSTKRQLNEQVEEETPKRQKLIPETKAIPTITKLSSFKEFMLDKTLKGLTRDQLEVLCIQKMCESIRQKSEIGDLKVKIKSQQQILESLRKEAVAIGKQTRDLGIVFDKINQDVANLADKPDKPLNIPKITRSVGLQAIVKDDIRRKPKVLPTSPIPNKPQNPQNKSPRITPPNNPPIVSQQLPNLRIYPNNGQKSLLAKKVKSPVQNRSPPMKKSDNKGVIDLTDDDDRKAPMSKAQNGTKINMINAPNGHKFVVMPNGQTVMVKLASPNIVVTQSLRSVQLPVKNRQSNFPQQNNYPSNRQTSPKVVKHPAPLPSTPPCSSEISRHAPPPKPQLMLNKTACGTGIILSWKMPYNLDLFEEIASYQLFAYQETKSDPKTDTWGKIGDVKALELPMAVTLTQFAVGNRYYFAVRAVDVLKRYGPFSEYQTILL